MTTELKNHPEGCSCGAPDCTQWIADQKGISWEEQATATHREQICDKINERIHDLGLEDTETNCYGLVCYDDTGIEGDYFRIDGDNSGAVEIDGPATIKSLEEVGYTGDFETDRDNFYAALVEFKSEDTE